MSNRDPYALLDERLKSRTRTRAELERRQAFMSSRDPYRLLSQRVDEGLTSKRRREEELSAVRERLSQQPFERWLLTTRLGRTLMAPLVGAENVLLLPVRALTRERPIGEAAALNLPEAQRAPVAEWVGRMAGEMAAFGVAGGAALRAATAPITTRVLARMGPIAGTRLAPYVASMVQAGGEGAAFGVLETLSRPEVWDEVSRVRREQGTVAATSYLAKHVGLHAAATGAGWAALGGIVDLMSRGAIGRRHLEEALKRPTPEELLATGGEVTLRLRGGKWEVVPPEQAGPPASDAVLRQMEAQAIQRMRARAAAKEPAPAAPAPAAPAPAAPPSAAPAPATPEQLSLFPSLPRVRVESPPPPPPPTPPPVIGEQITLTRTARPHLMHRPGYWGEAAKYFRRHEQGAMALDVPGRALVEATAKEIRTRRELLDPVAVGAARFMDDPSLLRDYSRWAAALRQKVVDEVGADAARSLDPHLPRLFEDAKKMYASVRVSALSRALPSVERLLDLVRKGEAGHEWYQPVRNKLHEALTPDEVEFLINAFVATQKHGNVRGGVTKAVKALSQYIQGRPITGLGLGGETIVERLRAGEPPEQVLGRKMLNFYRAMRGDPDAVVVDVWMMRAFGFKGDNPTDRQYDLIEAWVRSKARELGMTPAEFQARVWTGIRSEMNVRDPAESLLSTLQSNPRLLSIIQIVRGRRVNGEVTTPPEWRTPEGIRRAVGEQEYAILTWQNPVRGPKYKLRPGGTPNDALLRELTDRGYTEQNIIPLKGVYGGKAEDSFLVIGMSPKEAIHYGLRGGQSTVITRDGMVDVLTGEMAPRTSVVRFGDDALATDGYSLIQTPAGPLPFRIEYDFDALVPHPALRGPRAVQTHLLGETGAVDLPGGEPPTVRVKWNPETGKVELPPNAPPSLIAQAQQLEEQFRRANFRRTLQTGEPFSAPLESTIRVRGGRVTEVQTGQLPLFPGIPAPGAKLGEEPGLGMRIVRGAEEVATAFKLTGPLTHIRNITSNTLVLLLRPLEAEAAGAISLAHSLLTGAPRTRYMGEGIQLAVGMYSAIPDTMRTFLRAWRGELMVGSKFLESQAAVPGRIGETIRTPFRLLAAADEAFAEINRRATIYQLAYREAVKEGKTGQALIDRMAELTVRPTKAMLKEAVAKAQEYTFHEALGQQMTAVANAIRSVPGSRFVIPFLETPTNVSKYFARRTPLGALTAIGKEAGTFEDNLARAAVGSLLSFATVYWAMTGRITGAGPSNPKQREMLLATGWQPYSVRIGNTWVSYRGFEPIATFLAMAANMVEAARSGEDIRDMASRMTAAAMRGITDATYVNAMSELMDALTSPGETVSGLAKYTARQLTGAIVPAAVAAAARTLDPVERERVGMLEAVQEAIPGLRSRLPARLDVFGQEVRRGGIPLLTPRLSQIRQDPLAAELVRLGVTLPAPAPTVVRQGQPVKRPREEVRRIRTERGLRYRERLTRLIESPLYQRLSDDQKREVLRRPIRHIVEMEEGH